MASTNLILYFCLLDWLSTNRLKLAVVRNWCWGCLLSASIMTPLVWNELPSFLGGRFSRIIRNPPMGMCCNITPRNFLITESSTYIKTNSTTTIFHYWLCKKPLSGLTKESKSVTSVSPGISLRASLHNLISSLSLSNMSRACTLLKIWAPLPIPQPGYRTWALDKAASSNSLLITSSSYVFRMGSSILSYPLRRLPL